MKVLKDIGLTTADAGGKLRSPDAIPILPSPFARDAGRSRSGRKKRRAGGTLEAKLSGQGQDISWTCARHCGVSPDLEGKMETIMVGRLPGGYAVSPFLKMGMRFFARHAMGGTCWR